MEKKLQYFISAMHFLGGLILLISVCGTAYNNLSFPLYQEPVWLIVLLLISLTIGLVIACVAMYDGYSVFTRKKISLLTKILLIMQVPFMLTPFIGYQFFLGLYLNINFKLIYTVADQAIRVSMDLGVFRSTFTLGLASEGFFNIGINLVPLILLFLITRFQKTKTPNKVK